MRNILLVGSVGSALCATGVVLYLQTDPVSGPTAGAPALQTSGVQGGGVQGGAVQSGGVQSGGVQSDGAPGGSVQSGGSAQGGGRAQGAGSAQSGGGVPGGGSAQSSRTAQSGGNLAGRTADQPAAPAQAAGTAVPAPAPGTEAAGRPTAGQATAGQTTAGQTTAGQTAAGQPATGTAGQSGVAAATGGTGAPGAGTSSPAPASQAGAPQRAAGQQAALQPGRPAAPAPGDGGGQADAPQPGAPAQPGVRPQPGAQAARTEPGTPQTQPHSAAPATVRPSTPQDQPGMAAPPPSFDVVRIDRDGTAVMAGRAPAGALILLRRAGETIAEARSDDNGEWVLVLDRPLPPGPAQLDLEATLADGRTVPAEAALAVVVPEREVAVAAAPEAAAGPARSADATPPPRDTAIAVLLPRRPEQQTRILQRPEPAPGTRPEGLNLDKVDYDEQGNVVISGTAEPGSAVRIYVDNKPVGDSAADASGQWTVKPQTPIEEGDYRLRADQLDSGGKVVARLELPFTRVAVRRLLAVPSAHRVVVQPGNSLWRIARRVYGSGVQFTVIYRANVEQIRNPHLIYPGQVFDVPEVRDQ